MDSVKTISPIDGSIIVTRPFTGVDEATEIIEKANCRIGIFISLNYKLNRLSLEKIYMGYIRPILEHGDII